MLCPVYLCCEDMAKKFETKQSLAGGRSSIGEPVNNSMPQDQSVPAKLWRWLRTVVSNVTVEPVEFIYCLMTTTSYVVRDNLFLEKVCRLDMDYGEDVCYNLTHGVSWLYRVTMVVRDYILMTLFLESHNFTQLLCNFCPICSCQA